MNFIDFCQQLADQPVEPVGAGHKTQIHDRHDQYIEDRRRSAPQCALHRKPQRFQRRNVAGVEIVEIGLK